MTGVQTCALPISNRVAEIWTEHFIGVLNQVEPEVNPDIPATPEVLGILDAPPTYAEICDVVYDLNTGKAPGIDQIPSEFLRCNVDTISNILQVLFKKIWLEENVPEDWRRGLIIKLPKKGNLTDPNNWRGITLLPVASKVFLKVIHQRISQVFEEKSIIEDEQAGFRPGRSCTDQIFILRNIIEQSQEWQLPLHINFIDFSKAFDSVHRDSLWKILEYYGIPPKLVRLIKMFYDDYRCAVRQPGVNPEWFEVQSGVRQGCVISPFLFIIAVDYLMKLSQRNYKLGLRWNLTTRLNYLAYADDIALFATKHTGLQDFTNTLSAEANSIGLRINVNKTKIMRAGVHKQSIPNQQITIGGKQLEYVSEFPYLGAMVTESGGSDLDVDSRIRKATMAYYRLSRIWYSKSLSHKLKIKIFKSNVLSVLLYGSETWKLTDDQLNKLKVFQTTYTRRIMNVKWFHRVTNKDLLKRSRQDDMGEIMERRRWKYVGHVLRRRGAPTEVSLGWAPEGKRRPGRPKQTWRRAMLKRLTTSGVKSWSEAAELAKDRLKWQEMGKLMSSTQRVTRHSAN